MSDRIIRTFYESNGFKMEAEIYDNKVFGHITVYMEGPSVMRHIKRKWKEALSQAKDEGHDHLFAYTQNPKFVEFLGGANHIDNAEFNGKQYEVYSWELK